MYTGLLTSCPASSTPRQYLRPMRVEFMKTKINRLLIGMLAAAAMLAANISHAVEITGTLGSPSATTTLSGNQLPARPEVRRGD